MTIDKYSEKNKGDFENIWVNWLADSMRIKPEEKDVEEVQNPVSNYIQEGGGILCK